MEFAGYSRCVGALNHVSENEHGGGCIVEAGVDVVSELKCVTGDAGDVDVFGHAKLFAAVFVADVGVGEDFDVASAESVAILPTLDVRPW